MRMHQIAFTIGSLAAAEAGWAGEATFEGLGELRGGSNGSEAHDVSDDGLVVVGFSFSTNGTEAFRWENGTMVALGDLPGGGFFSHA